MRYEIILTPEAIEDLRRLSARERSVARDALERYLRHEPTRASKSRIKRLRRRAQPQYRLRVDELRVFYDVIGSEVQVLAIVPKPEAEAWLQRLGEHDETGAGDDSEE